MLFILLCFSGTLMDVIIIRIVILFKVWEKLEAYEHVLSTAYKDSSNSREFIENVSCESSKKIADWNFILSEAQMLNTHWLAASFQMQIRCATNWKDPDTMRKRNFSSEFFSLVPSSKLKTDMCFSSFTLTTSHNQPGSFFFLTLQYFDFKSGFFFQFLLAHCHFWDGLTAEGVHYKENQSSVRIGPRLDCKERLIFPDWLWELKMLREIPSFY